MARTKSASKITKVEEETRRETLQRGIKHGSIQNTIDKALDKYGEPLTDQAVNLFKKAHPGAEVAKPAVDAFVKGSILAGLAEIVGAAHMVGGKIPGLKKIDEEKYKTFAGYLRGYAGQRTGTKTADGMFELAPIVANMLSNPALKELLGDDEKPAQLTEGDKSNKVEPEGAVKKLSDDD
jgi:hypothetical protein